MYKFNPTRKETLNIGEALGPAMNITSQMEADYFLRDYTLYLEKKFAKVPLPEKYKDFTVEEIAKLNIAYFSGYFPAYTTEAVIKHFNAEEVIRKAQKLLFPQLIP